MATNDQPEQSGGRFSNMPFLEHLEELRKRLIRSIIALIIAAGGSFYFAEHIIKFIMTPLGDTKLYVTEVTGTFTAYFKISLITGLLVALPFIFWQLWSFISPGLYKREKLLILPIVLASTTLFLLGAVFCFYVMLPITLAFLIHYGEGLIEPMITISSYIGFVGMLILGFGAGFQLPIVAYVLGKFGIVSARGLNKARRYAIVILLFLAAFLTPTPDMFTMMVMFVPLYALYEISILIVWLTGKKKNAQVSAD
ncbi:MAG: twin-arginine translocase subunit TatC [candidate division Zixibacteria bacterium]|nr:twin-arginine translocase subunit TatC [candidate division Zixibacteria bacterium]